jgi:hypothetical protein
MLHFRRPPTLTTNIPFHTKCTSQPNNQLLISTKHLFNDITSDIFSCGRMNEYWLICKCCVGKHVKINGHGLF